MLKIEHIGIAVSDLEVSENIFAKIMNTSPYKREEVANQKVITSFLQAGNSKIELLKPTSEDSVIEKFLQKRGSGIHHIAFLVEDIPEEIARLKQTGFEFVSEEMKPGSDNKLTVFLHPKYTSGVLIELCQEQN